jgi:hypothetical protein
MTRSLTSFPLPLDRVALTLMTILGVLIGLLLWGGDHTLPRVRDFSWQGKQVGVADSSFVLYFNRLMDWQSVSKQLAITPPLAGKASWSGRRFVYTLTEPIPYGSAFELKLAEAIAATPNRNKQLEAAPAKPMQSFAGQFRSRDRALVYIGSTNAEAGRLVLYNLTLQRKTILTPPNLEVYDFKPYPNRDRILFSASERSQGEQAASDLQLYAVATGLKLETPQVLDGTQAPEASSLVQERAGTVKKILDGRDYQLLKFDLSADGQNIVAQRASRSNQGLTSLWLIKGESQPETLLQQAGGDFLIAPDSNTLVMSQGQGLAIAPLTLDSSSKDWDFLPQFGMVLNFTPDGSAAAMVKFNSDFTRALYLVTNQGTTQQLLQTTGSIISAQFDPQQRWLYCLLTQLLPGEDYKEQPYIAAINLQTGKLTPLATLSGFRDTRISLAPDGSALLFNQTDSTPASQPTIPDPKNPPRSTSQIWSLPLAQSLEAKTISVQPPQAIAAGHHGMWLP